MTIVESRSDGPAECPQCGSPLAEAEENVLECVRCMRRHGWEVVL